MIVNEKEARKKICPVALAGGLNQKCSGGDCIAWEWYNDYEGYCGMVRGDIEFLKRNRDPMDA